MRHEIDAELRKARREYLDLLEDLRSKFPRVLDAEYVYQKILAKREKGEKPLFTGVEWWDEWAGPLRRANTYVLAGYPGAGKTTLALNLAWSMAQRGLKTWYFCLELTADEVFEVLAGHIMKKAVLSHADENLAYSIIQPTGFRFFESEQYMPWNKHLEVIQAEVVKENIDFLVIDNLSFLTRVERNTHEVENVASAKIKALSQQLEIPILLIHHLRKPDNDQREPEPNVHAMRGSGAILADASDAFILHHPVEDSDSQTRHPVGYILSGKPRWGMGGKRYLRLDGPERTYYPAIASEYRGRVNSFRMPTGGKHGTD